MNGIVSDGVLSMFGGWSKSEYSRATPANATTTTMLQSFMGDIATIVWAAEQGEEGQWRMQRSKKLSYYAAGPAGGFSTVIGKIGTYAVLVSAFF